MRYSSLRTAALITLAVVLFIAAGCRTQGSTTQPLPASNDVAGWEKTGATRTFTAANLSDYIDGGADQYLKAGFKSVSTSDYKFQGKIEATADVYAMTDANAAKTIFEADPAGTARIIALGDAGRAFSQSVVFRKGPYLARVVAYQETPETQQSLIQLAQGIAKRVSN
jgi:hypothetical protein